MNHSPLPHCYHCFSSAIWRFYANHLLASQKPAIITSELWFHIIKRPEFEPLGHFFLLWKAAGFCCLFSASIFMQASIEPRRVIRDNGFSDVWTLIFAALKRNFSKSLESQKLVSYKYQTNSRGALVEAAQKCHTEWEGWVKEYLQLVVTYALSHRTALILTWLVFYWQEKKKPTLAKHQFCHEPLTQEVKNVSETKLTF